MDEVLYLVCQGCGEAFTATDRTQDFLFLASTHGKNDPNCASEGFHILPESEAM